MEGEGVVCDLIGIGKKDVCKDGFLGLYLANGLFLGFGG